MKNIHSLRNITLLILTMLVVNSCTDDFIELKPISNANVENFFKTQSDFESAMTAAYASFASSGTYRDNIQLIGDLRSDNSEMGTTASVRFPYFDMSEFREQVTSPIFESVWNDSYRGIARVNLIIEKLEETELDAAFETRTKAECQFIRALHYFNLVRVFGDIPLVLSNIAIEEAYEMGRTPQEQVYQQIIDDFTFAADNLPNTIAGEEGRATRGAALALLGKTLLTLNDFQQASVVLKEVIDLNQYELLENYADLWKVENENHKESIFDIQFTRSSTFNTGSYFVVRYTPYLYPYLSYYSTGGGYNIPTEDMINAYEPGDIRKDASVREYYIDPDSDTISGLEGRYCIKYYDTPTQGEGADNNWPVIRYVDVVLMYAEALNELGFNPSGEAFTYLNLVRSRAGLPEKTSGNPDPLLAINSQQDFRLAIEQERRVELAFEGHRWFDLVRTGRALEVLNPKTTVNIQPYQLLLPVPQAQIDINPQTIKQNDGY